MGNDAEHRWLGYEPVVGDRFIAVCSCGWRSPAQRTAGVAGALLDAHRNEVRSAQPKAVNGASAGSTPPLESGGPDDEGA